MQIGETCIAKTPHETSLPPCKLLTRLAANPGTDITQIPTPLEDTDNSGEVEGVECAKAYQMLMQFATEDKLDSIAQTLENGCVEGPGGGCQVPNKIVWKALDEMQS